MIYVLSTNLKTLRCSKTSSPEGSDRLPESQQEPASHQNILNSSQILSKICFNWSRAANSAVHCWILPNFELIRDFMVVLVARKNEEL